MKQRVITNNAESMLNLLGLKYRSNTRLLTVMCVTIPMIIAGFLNMHYQPLQAIINAQVKITPYSLLYKFFQSPPIDVTISIYVFNITNSEQFLAGKEKIKLQEVGPYVYQEELVNINPVFNENGTLSFTSRRYTHFRRDLSIGDDKADKIISCNIPLLGIMSFLKDKSIISNLLVSQIANILNSKSIVEVTVDEYLWGYDDKLVTLAHNALPNWINFGRFGIFDRIMALDNASSTVTIKLDGDPLQSKMPGEPVGNSPYTIVNFNGSPGLHQWGYKDVPHNKTSPTNTRCNTIAGYYESGVFDTDYLQENMSIALYRRAFCRPMPMQYVGRSQVGGFDAVGMKIHPKFLALPEVNPDNECYCNKPGIKCKYHGIGYLNPCYYGIPITISLPHFLDSDPRLLEQVDGLKPEVERHETRLFISENIGIPIEANLRVQINMEIDTRLSARTAPFNGLMLPLFWIEMKEHKLYWIIYLADYGFKYIVPIVSGLVSWMLMIFGFAITATGVLLTFYRNPQQLFEDPFDNKIGYTPIRMIPVYASSTIRISK